MSSIISERKNVQSVTELKKPSSNINPVPPRSIAPIALPVIAPPRPGSELITHTQAPFPSPSYPEMDSTNTADATPEAAIPTQLSYHEHAHTHAKYFDFFNRLPDRFFRFLKSEHVSFTPTLQTRKVEQISEVCPCCVGVPDFDEAIALAKLSTVQEAANAGQSPQTGNPPSVQKGHFALDQLAAVPETGLDWFLAGITAYLAGAGMYFGYVNFKGSEARLNQVHKILNLIFDEKNPQSPISELKESIRAYGDLKEKQAPATVLQAKLGTIQHQFQNIKAYLSNLHYSNFDGQFQRWGAGAMPFSASSVMMSSLLYPPLVAPALGMMSVYAWTNAVKYGVDRMRLGKSKPLDAPVNNDPLYRTGRQSYTSRITAKFRFLHTIIPCWSAYGIGTGVLCATAASALAGVAFPPALIFTGAGLLLTGILSVLYLNNKSARDFAPKNQDDIHRTKLGSQTQILRAIGWKSEQRTATNDYFNRIHDRLSFGQKLNLASRHFAYGAATVLFLGIPQFIRTINHRRKIAFVRMGQNPEDLRNAFMKQMIQNDIQYLNEIKNSRRSELTDTLPRHGQPGNSIDDVAKALINLEQNTVDARIAHETTFLQKLETPDAARPGEHLRHLWRFLAEHNLTHMVMEKLLTENRHHLEKLAPFITSESAADHSGHSAHSDPSSHAPADHCEDNCAGHSHHDARTIQVDLEALLTRLEAGDPQALSVYRTFTQTLDRTLLFDNWETLTYDFRALCDQIEQRRRQTEVVTPDLKSPQQLAGTLRAHHPSLFT